MVLATTEIVSEISLIIGDLAEQFQGEGAMLKIETEIANTMLFLTTANMFSWNVRRVSGVTHTNGVIPAPTGLGRLVFMSDNAKNESYYLASYEEFSMLENNSDREITWEEKQPIPFIISVNTTSGSEQIEIATGVGTPSSRTFNMVYTQSTTVVSEVWIPERIRPFIISFTVANLAAKIDSPDSSALLSTHDKIAQLSLRAELNFATNRGMSRVNTNLRVSPNHSVNVGGNIRY